MRKTLKVVGYTVAVAAFLFSIFYAVTWLGFRTERQDVAWGVTFSTVMARRLGLDPSKTFDAVTSDLGARRIRVPVYWSEVEPNRGEFHFNEYDTFVRKAEGVGVKLLLAVGRKLPRWPECHIPLWAYRISSKEQQRAVEEMIRVMVERYRDSPAVEAWQVENEPFFGFGEGCAAETLPPENVKAEVDIVRSLDNRRVIVTDSGEQGRWIPAARYADILGITLYRQTWNSILGFVRFPFGPGFYRMKRWLFEKVAGPKEVRVVELQAEPWGPGKLLPEYDIKIQKELMDVEKFRETISYARRTGFDTFYLWGVEWWYWLKEVQKDVSIWDEAKLLFGGNKK